MTQLDLTLTPPSEKPPRRRVRAVSRQAYAEGRARFTGRKANVLRWLAAYYNLSQTWPTSAELADFADTVLDDGGTDWTAHLLFTRRGLSDLQRTGSVEAIPDGRRICRWSQRTCETWRIPSR